MKRMLAVLLVLMLFGGLLGACAPQATEAAPAEEEAPAEEQAPAGEEAPAEEAPAQETIPVVLTIGMGVEPETLDPGDAVYIGEQFVLMNVFDSLLSLAPDNTLHPGLALGWEASDDFTEFTFTLRTDVTFHDGTPFTAEAVKATFDHIAGDAVLSSGGKTMLVDHGYVETEVVDDATAVVRFSASYPTFLRDASRPWLGISSPTALETYGTDYGRNPVGTGPFKFVEWAVQQQIVLEANPDYNWAPEFSAHQGPALVDQVVFRILPDAATRLTALQTGEILIAEEPPALDAISMVEAGEAAVYTFTSPGMPSHMMINSEKAPTDDLRVRQAMVYAVNQEELVQTAFGILGVAAHNVLSPTTWSYDEQSASLYRYDPEKAAELLDEAGWVDSDGDGIREKDGENLHLVYLAIPAYEEAFMELLAAYLTAAGFEVEISILDDAGVFAEGSAGNHNLLNMGWTSTDPGVMNIVYNSANIDGGSAFTRFRSEELDGALNDAQTQLDEAVRLQDYITVQQVIMENALIIPVHCYNRVFLASMSVENFAFDVEGYPWLYDISVAE